MENQTNELQNRIKILLQQIHSNEIEIEQCKVEKNHQQTKQKDQLAELAILTKQIAAKKEEIQ